MTQRARPEQQFQTQVIELAQYGGWAHYHPPDNLTVAMRSGRTRRQAVVKGFPDLTLVRAPELIFAELKAENGRLSPEQRDWLHQLELCGIEVHVWRPSDFDAVHARLTGPRRPAIVLDEGGPSFAAMLGWGSVGATS